MKEDKRAVLLLEDGTVFEGQAMGACGKALGTVVFNTSMVGYQEALTNPANHGLLLAQTFPLIGNYGINAGGWESETAHAAGYIVREHCGQPSNYLSKGTLNDFLVENKVVGICGIDTRHLTKQIREKGEMKGMIVSEGTIDIDALLAEVRTYIPEDEVQAVSRGGGSTWAAAGEQPSVEGRLNVGVLDLGAPQSLYHTLMAHGCDTRILHCAATAREIQSMAANGGIDGIVLSDGPGNPDANHDIIENVREICKLGIPVLGISLGHQVLALANGMQVKRLKYGHRGANQPVLSKLSGRTYITSQNHAYIVDGDSIDPAVCEMSFANGNDGTCEGLVYKNIPAFSVQFLPDAEVHTHSTAFIYKEFIQLMRDAAVKAQADKKGGK